VKSLDYLTSRDFPSCFVTIHKKGKWNWEKRELMVKYENGKFYGNWGKTTSMEECS